MTDETPTTKPASDEKHFTIEKVYIKDASLESPNSPEVFTVKWEPELNIQVGSTGKKLDANTYEVVLTVTSTAKLGDKSAYLAEVQQAGIFTVRGFPEAELSQLLGNYCLSVLYPYASASISNMINNAGFPPLHLAPLNFEAMWAKQQEANAQADATPAVSH